MNEWKDRVSENEKVEAAKSIASIIGKTEAATALMRFARDDAYASLEYLNPKTSSFLAWADLAEELTSGIDTLPVSYTQMRDAALRHIQEFKGTQTLHKQQEVPRASLTAGVMMKAKTFPTAIHAIAN